MIGWWRRRSLRARLTLLSTALLIIGLSLGTLAIAAVFDHNRIGVLDAAAKTESTQLASLVNAAELPQPLPVASGQSAQVLTPTGGVLAASAEVSRTLPLVASTVLTADAGGRSRTLAVTAIDDEDDARVIVTRATYAGKPVFVVVAARLSDVRATEKSLRGLEFVAVPSLVAVVAALSWLLLGRALTTVSALGEAAASVTDPSSGVRLPVPGSRDEIYGLAVTLNAMLDRLAASNARERAFLDDAAHELRTPLASARVQLEVAGLHPLDQDWEAIAAATTADLERLGQLLDDLLALARLDASGIRQRRLDLAAIAGISNVEPVWIVGDRSALRRSVANLVANAQRHAAHQVSVTVTAVAGLAVLRVEDDGPGIPTAERPRIFDRFARLDDGRTREEGGTGLGLAIVAATARAHGGEAFVEDSSLGGAPSEFGFRWRGSLSTMDLNELLLDSLTRIQRGTATLLSGCREGDLVYRADAEANTIGWLAWHIARGQDAQLAALAGTEQVWVLGGWGARMGLDFAADDIGYGATSDEVSEVRTSAELLTGYLDEVTAASARYVAGLTPAELDRVVDEHWDPPVTVGARLISIIADDLQHLGQAAFVKGLAGRA